MAMVAVLRYWLPVGLDVKRKTFHRRDADFAEKGLGGLQGHSANNLAHRCEPFFTAEYAEFAEKDLGGSVAMSAYFQLRRKTIYRP
jgi:hypothetical protein